MKILLKDDESYLNISKDDFKDIAKVICDKVRFISKVQLVKQYAQRDKILVKLVYQYNNPCEGCEVYNPKATEEDIIAMGKGCVHKGTNNIKITNLNNECNVYNRDNIKTGKEATCKH
ncbi:hypothetical protein BJV85_002096 [Clostridium acetobutylicum]|uniref:Uncharacterized protein n=1 Tax=Clostridium acetobutylicum (strain ATCC 824 / DSM 792 / JCM 1419 / IAM 19013 / LMG 5710 / NBRC 13948 / NRRL B-527 / VKM B-1787 / 2291 / W) TaxID=272562 RepID=Q97HV6_CLOAB|nr:MULTISPECIES: hypothetical protein [Clostridium]AAK79864.1 Hypothetical protein CA_C1901 [Clostridium acetobutylicum ATCC 824]ADZ20950.1 Conserved hypothetical protein [Clostridium acetobutylicum EA 2018]AEI32039.1 hypothetical protein SMB_G1926 [Clostridium acetobutylicum DSM 1731]AWV79707.1 hypothetical protein DK921_06255 [Clostridium acetobutylicum]MBC2394316.1 hypothetical protein [Clostridium acetobutylicum]